MKIPVVTETSRFTAHPRGAHAPRSSDAATGRAAPTRRLISVGAAAGHLLPAWGAATR
jgi:hypothetical protein